MTTTEQTVDAGAPNLRALAQEVAVARGDGTTEADEIAATFTEAAA